MCVLLSLTGLHSAGFAAADAHAFISFFNSFMKTHVIFATIRTLILSHPIFHVHVHH